MRTPLCEDLGIQYPVIAFTPSEHVAAAVSRAPVAAAAPPARPSLAPGVDNGVRVAPRPVAVRPPGM